MRFKEFMESAGATTSGAIATVPAAIGAPITRSGGSFFTGKYTNDPFPNTPKKIKKKRK
jgi:hypothetical protein